ncbi:hypothetical protein SAMN05660733_02346 [Lentzea albidocapillata]|uniref:Uncharacterized protein n=2 Tax=Lentzea albidocapillata TaxID=40571 RepID=A0A1W2CSR4_9PSEU|nr:hypothetical protein [Lentzea albidocapillata]SMC88285.1 hypothetical protein SAMN05660733_02346 [Lentzea albidocapillata]
MYDQVERQGQDFKDSVADQKGNVEDYIDRFKTNDEAKDGATEAAIKGIEELASQFIKAVNELGDSGAPVSDAVSTYMRDGFEGTKIIVEGWIDGLKKRLAGDDAAETPGKRGSGAELPPPEDDDTSR